MFLGAYALVLPLELPPDSFLADTFEPVKGANYFLAYDLESSPERSALPQVWGFVESGWIVDADVDRNDRRKTTFPSGLERIAGRRTKSPINAPQSMKVIKIANLRVGRKSVGRKTSMAAQQISVVWIMAGAHLR